MYGDIAVWVLCMGAAGLVDLYGEGLGDGEAVALVVDDDEGSADGLAFLAEFLEELAVEPPLKVQGVLGDDLIAVGGVVGYPLSADFHLGARDVEEDALVEAFVEREGLSRVVQGAGVDVGGQGVGHEVGLDVACGVDEV